MNRKNKKAHQYFTMNELREEKEKIHAYIEQLEYEIEDDFFKIKEVFGVVSHLKRFITKKNSFWPLAVSAGTLVAGWIFKRIKK